MTYQHINAGDENNAWKKLLELVNGSAYSASVYANLESFFQQQGYPEFADEVFTAQKWRERTEFMKWYSIGWWKNLLM